MSEKIVYVVTDAENKLVCVFEDGQRACDFAESDRADAWYVEALNLLGNRKTYARFWCATLELKTGNVRTDRDTIYRAGSLKEPCRHGWRTFHRPIQKLDSIAAWAFTKGEAIRRVKLHEAEGRRRAARDKAYEEVERQGREELKAKEGGATWDPYGLWIERVPGLAERLKAAADAAYNGEVQP